MKTVVKTSQNENTYSDLSEEVIFISLVKTVVKTLHDKKIPEETQVKKLFSFLL